MKMTLCGTGSALPQHLRLSSAIDAELGLPDGTLGAATGVISRGVVAGAEDQLTLALAASQKALSDAGITAGDLQLVIGACAVPYQPLPAMAPLLAARLGVTDGQLAAFDVNSSCLSFVTGVDVAARMLKAGEYALVFSAELASRALPWQSQPEVAALFGDGAGAVVLRGGGADKLKASLFRSYPSGWQACEIGAGGTRFDYHRDPEGFAAHATFRMEGRELFRLTAKHFGAFVTELLQGAGWRADEVDLVVPHQASPAGLKHMIRITGFAPERVVDISAQYGNQIAASIPFVLDHARRHRDLPQGTKILILGTSAGVSFGGLALEL